MRIQKILVMGLPNSGKSSIAGELSSGFLVPHHNEHTYRKYYDDWDFSAEGRKRQSFRLKNQFGILDSVCPTEELRKRICPEITIWLNTIKEIKPNGEFNPPKYPTYILSYNINLKRFRENINTWTNENGIGMSSLVDFLISGGLYKCGSTNIKNSSQTQIF